MAFFSKGQSPAPTSPEALAPLSKDRIKVALEAEQWSYSVDSDGDIGGGWEYASFYFFVNGDSDELLCIRGTWRGQLESDQLLPALEAANTWNSDKLWPKTYVRPDEDGMLRMHAELNIDFEQGVSDGQLRQQLLCMINTAMAYFEDLNERFPEVWEKYKPAES